MRFHHAYTKIFGVLLAFSLLMACRQTSQSPIQKIWNTAQLPQQTFVVNNQRDTVLESAEGVRMFIKAGSFSGADKVELIFKEALTADEIVAAGLTTMSDGKPLQSAGMFSLYAKDEKVQMVKTIAVQVPAEIIEQDMQLFKGQMAEDSTLNWVEPTPIEQTSLKFKFENGKQLFVDLCASCHKIDKPSTGPALRGAIERRGDLSAVYAFTNNNIAVRATCDPYYTKLYLEWNKTSMTAFPNLHAEELDAIYSYIEQKDIVLKNGNDAAIVEKGDRCLELQRQIDEIQATVNGLQQEEKDLNVSLENSKKELVNVSYDIPVTGDSIIDSNQVSVEVAEAEKRSFYQVEIKTFGWFNLDMFMMDNSNFTDALLKVKFVGAIKDDPRSYLIIPKYKIFAHGGKLSTGTFEHGFGKLDGTLKLPLNQKAYVVAITDIGDELYYTIQEFRTSVSQTMELELKKVTAEGLELALRRLTLENIAIDVHKPPKQVAEQQKRVAAIQAEAKLVEARNDSLRVIFQKDCDCGVKEPNDSTSNSEEFGNGYGMIDTIFRK
jgi:cytochrome c2